jgi:hypothetical protein
MHRVTGSALRLFAGTIVLAVTACSPQSSGGRPTRSAGSVIAGKPDTPASPAVASDTGPDDRPRLARLEREARDLAKTAGCSSVSACRTAPVGWRGCGGPRSYLVYCAATTDTVALFRKLKELENAEKDYNAKSGMMSTCEYRMPPGVKLDGGSCKESPAGP